MKKIILVVILLMIPVFQAGAVEPNEMLSDPVLEARAREISKGLRCMQCQNENIDVSSADIARDLRLAVRERLVAGDTDDQTVAYIVDRYGEFALLSPTKTGMNLFLWFAGPAMFLLAFGVGVTFLRRSARRQENGSNPTIDNLSEEETARLDDIINR
ncbi:cytochrome c-type biogenesis protein [Falsihalocynthiibacter arcticus]|uniref:Cytochrome c-type biogenesis protein n=1 Tax=Falsihalocynthiibacter arcticus TaxID=1579316 RepID=A0A126V2A7_9RHOB|nr:cytochrome c-type biogenesis protein [Falsihalocynthiibacter arcticus]AML52461.1 cytochrome C biogenesis protein CcdA [Falsihalocynthiibacter arcticus]